jgi:F-type H+-transporting ATPase subunit gamma
MAGQSQREIRRRIRSVQNTQHITRAMQIVSAAKLRRVQGLVSAVAPFAGKLEEVLSGLASVGQHPLLQEREVKRVAYVVISADHGLAGGHSANVVEWAMQVLGKEQHPYDLCVLGRRGGDLLRARGLSLDEVYEDVGDDIDWYDARQLAWRLRQSFSEDKVDAVYLVYMTFVNAMVHRPLVKRLLPVGMLQGTEDRDGDVIFEPSPAEVLDVLLPRYVDTSLYMALLDAKCSEHGARMVAMRQATENAEEMIEALTLGFNQARQAGITREISEIVGGANALAGTAEGQAYGDKGEQRWL